MREDNIGFGDFYRIGLDIGIASVGWSCLACDENGDIKHILDLGVRTFDIPENPQDGGSLAAPRREKRSLRRRIRRKAHRLERARELLCINKENPNDYAGKQRFDVYELRAKAIDEKIEEKDFARVLMLILKRRGYKSNGKRENNADDGLVKDAIKKNRELLLEKGYRTVGEMLYCECAEEKDGIRTYNVRNHGNYERCIAREMLIEELQILFAKQRECGNVLATEEIEEKFIGIFSGQRSFDEGPGKGSKYSAEYKVGDCPFESGEKRAAKGTFAFEYFRLLQSLNHMKISSCGSVRTFTEEERKRAIEKCLYKERVTFADLRKYTGLADEELFDALYYGKNQESGIAAAEKKAKFCGMPGSGKIRAKLSEDNKNNTDLIDAVAEILSYNKSDKKIAQAFGERPICQCLSQEEKDALMCVNLSEFGHMSLKALKKAIPYLERGDVYSTAMEKAGYNHANPYGEVKKSDLIDVCEKSFREELEDITSPAVKRAVSQTIKVINAIIRKYGRPVAINVELARELGKSFDERKAIEKEGKSRFENNEKIMVKLKADYGIAVPTGQDLVKYRLYEEQDCKCIYSGKPLDIDRVLHDGGYAQVDHIIPYSRSFCDAQYNKVLVLSEENQKKGNRLPKEYLGDGERWTDFCVRVNAMPLLSRKKKETLLREKFTKENGKEWKDRTLNDTKYASKFIFNMLQRRLLFADCKMGAKRVFAVGGAITSTARKLWGIQKVRENGDLHHALDAIVIGCITDGFINGLNRYSKKKELKYIASGENIIDTETGEVIKRTELMEKFPDRLPMPHENFRKEIELRLSDDPKREEYSNEYYKFGYDGNEVEAVRKAFVSRAPERKAKGAIHLETVYSRDKAGNTVLKTAITDLKLKDGEIDNYNELAKQSDTLLYNALRKRLVEYGGDAKKAFAEPFYKPKADGSNGPLVKKVLIDQKASAPVDTGRGNAKNGSMVRTDVFCKGGKYYGVPVYALDVYRGTLPNKAVKSGKPEEQWIEMTADYEFKFSLYPNDLVRLESKKGIKFSPQNKDNANREVFEDFAYYKGLDRSTGAMSFILHDNSYFARGVGIQNLGKITKYVVDILGEVHEVKSEKRPPAKMKNK